MENIIYNNTNSTYSNDDWIWNIFDNGTYGNISANKFYCNSIVTYWYVLIYYKKQTQF